MSKLRLTPAELTEMLARTLDDGRLRRTEKRALAERLADHDPDDRERALFRHGAFELARQRMHDPRDTDLLAWLEDVVKLLDAQDHDHDLPATEAHFSPMEDCALRLVHLFEQARRCVDVCVYTITDDRLANAILAAHFRGVKIRIVTDGDKEYDLGSDIDRLREEGIAVREDDSEHHMHHKFALFDEAVLVTGSFNWTRAASRHNQENIVVTTDRRLVRDFQRTFDSLWERYADA